MGKNETYPAVFPSTFSLVAWVSMPCAATHEAPVGEGGVCALAGAVGRSRGPGFLFLSSSYFALGASFLEAWISGFQVLPSLTSPRHKSQVISLNAPPAGDVGS